MRLYGKGPQAGVYIWCFITLIVVQSWNKPDRPLPRVGSWTSSKHEPSPAVREEEVGRDQSFARSVCSFGTLRSGEYPGRSEDHPGHCGEVRGAPIVLSYVGLHLDGSLWTDEISLQGAC